ncbi:hypothetical protein CQA88_32080, partial [Klebsiella pneumoniae]
MRQRLTIPVVANGEIWTGKGARDCMLSRCDSVMIGRGALKIRQRLTIPVVANGEIWTGKGARDCMLSRCDSV